MINYILNLLNNFLKTEFVILFERIELLEKRMEEMNVILSILSEQITKTQQVQQQAVEALQKLSTQAVDQEALKALSDNLKASTDALAASVSAVTPASAEHTDPNQPAPQS